jgi:hypothetical protein
MLNALRQRLVDGMKSRGRRTTARRTRSARSPQLEPMEPRRLLTYKMVDAPRLVEGTGGTTQMAFTVGLSVPSTQAVTVNFATADGTARAGADYAARSGSLSFAPGETSKTVLVPIFADSAVELTETFSLRLSGATNAQVLRSTGVASILDDDTPVTPELSIDNPRIQEGNAGTRQLIFTVSLNVPVPDRSVTVKLSTQDGTAKAGSDYAARSEVLTFAPGETSKEFAVTLYGDTAVEATESFYVLLSQANVGLKMTSGVGLILNDDF